MPGKTTSGKPCSSIRSMPNKGPIAQHAKGLAEAETARASVYLQRNATRHQHHSQRGDEAAAGSVTQSR